MIASDEDTAATSQDGALERFIGAFNGYEADAKLFERCQDGQGFLWWDVVRYAVQFTIADERGFYSLRGESVPSTVGRFKRLAQHMVSLVRFILNALWLRRCKIDTLYVSTRALEEASAQILHDGSRVLYVNKAGKADAPHAALSKITIDFALRMLSPVFRVPPEVKRDVAEISAALKKHFDTDLNLSEQMYFKYKQSQAAFWVWRRILSRLPDLKRVVFVNDDMLRPLVALARVRELETIEVQHGYMGRSHFSFSYPKLPYALKTLADKVWIMHDTGDIVYPVPKVLLEKKATPPLGEKIRDIDVLVGGLPGRVDELCAIVRGLADAEMTVAVKLHPSQIQYASEIKRLLSDVSVKVFSNDIGFVSLAQRAWAYVPVRPTSTTAFEAVQAGAALFVIHHGGKKITSMCDAIATDEVNSIDGLCEAIAQNLKEVRDGI
jgi:hypothetical protein